MGSAQAFGDVNLPPGHQNKENILFRQSHKTKNNSCSWFGFDLPQAYAVLGTSV